jgi:hypothetical protein
MVTGHTNVCLRHRRQDEGAEGRVVGKPRDRKSRIFSSTAGPWPGVCYKRQINRRKACRFISDRFYVTQMPSEMKTQRSKETCILCHN